jgi:hypothetical protein
MSGPVLYGHDMPLAGVIQTTAGKTRPVWTRMPTVAEQIAIPGAFAADFTVVRALLQKARTYDQTVSLFEPYEKVQQPDPSTRSALRQIAEQCVREKRKACVFLNNRLEGNAPATIEAVASDEGNAT